MTSIEVTRSGDCSGAFEYVKKIWTGIGYRTCIEKESVTYVKVIRRQSNITEKNEYAIHMNLPNVNTCTKPKRIRLIAKSSAPIR